MACKLGGSIPRALAGNSSKAMGAPAKAVRGACAAGTKPTPGPPLAAMPTGILLRSTVMTSVMSTPLLFGPCLALLRRLTEPRALVFDESRNPLLRFLLRHTVYAQFNAGVNKQQVVGTIRALREIGFGGVILGHGREMMLPKQDADGILGSKGQHSLVEQWKQASLTTLDMIGEGDFLSIKYVHHLHYHVCLARH